VTYASGRAFRQALESRLREQALRTSTPLVRLRKLVAFDRFLARLACAQPQPWLLKGGFALQLRLADRARLTKDIDLLLRLPDADARLLLQQAVARDLGDWFAFAVAAPAQAGALAFVQRFPVHSMLDGRTFEDFHVDVGTGDPVVDEVDVLRTPALLAFAGLEPTAFPAYPLTQHIAEKLHAYTQPHEAGEGTRVRDLVDLLLIAGHAPIESGRLREAIEATFRVRATHALPALLPAPPAAWRAPFRQLAREVGLFQQDLTAGYAAAAQFLDPVLRAQAGGFWDAVRWSWAEDRG
jgi:hypothetical protein